MRSLSNIVKDRKTIDTVELYQFFSDFAMVEVMEEETDEEAAAPETTALEDAQEAKRQAEEALKNAREEAERLLEETRKQCEEIRQTAAEEGRVAGYNAGYEDGQKESLVLREQEIQALNQDMKELIDSVRAEKEALLEKYKEDLKKIALAIAEKVIHTSLKSSETVIHRMIMAATDKLKKTEWVKIYISRTETELAMSADTEFVNALAHLSDNVKIVSMDNDEAGVCIIELPNEIIDASVNTQLENIKDILNNGRT